MTTTLLVYRCAPNREHKADAELQRAGAITMLPDDTTGKRRKITAPSYVFGDRAVDLTWAKHVKPAIGATTLDAVMRMFQRPTPKIEPKRFASGDAIRILSGPFEGREGEITKERSRKWFEVALRGCRVTTAVQPRNMIHIDPG